MAEIDSSIVRYLIIATITDTQYLRGLRHLWMPNLVGSGWQWVAQKSFEYLDRFGEAPGSSIEAMWAADTKLNKETKEEIGDFLSSLNDEWQSAGQNADYLLDETEKYFARELYLQTAADLEGAIADGNMERAKQIIANSKPKQIITSLPSNPFKDRESLKAIFDDRNRSLVRLGGAFQEMVGSQIIPDSFVAFLGKEKVGKTWLKQSIVFGALTAGSNVLFLQCGDLSDFQQKARLMVQITGRNYKPKYCGRLMLPIQDCLRNQDASCNEANASTSIIINHEAKPYPQLARYEEAPDHKPCFNSICPRRLPSSWWEPVDPCSVLTEEEAWLAFQRFDLVAGEKIRLGCYLSKEICVRDIATKIGQMEDNTGWKPDVVVIDYADNLAPEPGSSNEYRHQVNANWEAMRRLSQDRHISVVTATQAPKETKGRLLRDNDMTEDKRKKAHVTAFFGLNKDVFDKRRGWMRINPLVIREDDYDTEDQAVVMQLVQRGRVNVGSFWYRRNTD